MRERKGFYMTVEVLIDGEMENKENESMNSTDNKFDQLDCADCGAKCQDKIELLVLHVMSHNNFKRYGCSKCDYSSRQQAQIEDHIKSKHADNAHFEDKLTRQMLAELVNLTGKCFQGINQKKLIEWRGQGLSSLQIAENNCLEMSTDEEMTTDGDATEPPKKKSKLRVSFADTEEVFPKGSPQEIPSDNLAKENSSTSLANVSTEEDERKIECKDCGHRICLYNDKGTMLLKSVITHIGTHILHKRAKNTGKLITLKEEQDKDEFMCVYCPYKTAVRGNFKSHNKSEHGEDAEIIENMDKDYPKAIFEKGKQCFPDLTKEIEEHCMELEKQIKERPPPIVKSPLKVETLKVFKTVGRSRGRKKIEAISESKNLGKAEVEVDLKSDSELDLTKESLLKSPGPKNKRQSLDNDEVDESSNKIFRRSSRSMTPRKFKNNSRNTSATTPTPASTPTKTSLRKKHHSSPSTDPDESFKTPMKNSAFHSPDAYETPAATFRMHSVLEPLRDPDFECQFCEDRLWNRRGNIALSASAIDHGFVHLGKLRYRCSGCQHAFSRPWTTQTHIKKKCQGAKVVDLLNIDLLTEVTVQAQKCFPELSEVLDEWKELTKKKFALSDVAKIPEAEMANDDPIQDEDDASIFKLIAPIKTEVHPEPIENSIATPIILPADENIYVTPIVNMNYEVSPHPTIASLDKSLHKEIESLKGQLEEKQRWIEFIQKEKRDLAEKYASGVAQLPNLRERLDFLNTMLPAKEKIIEQLEVKIEEQNVVITNLREQSKQTEEKMETQQKNIDELVEKYRAKTEEGKADHAEMIRKHDELTQDLKTKDLHFQAAKDELNEMTKKMADKDLEIGDLKCQLEARLVECQSRTVENDRMKEADLMKQVDELKQEQKNHQNMLAELHDKRNRLLLHFGKTNEELSEAKDEILRLKAELAQRK